jgi:hypothetical protein
VSAKVVYMVKQSLMGKTYYYLSLKWDDIKTGKPYYFHQRVSHKKWYPLGSSVCIQFDPDDPSFYIVDISLPLWMWGDLIHIG